MIIKRNLLNVIEPFLKRKEFISIVGPRQSGKTTFLNILRDYLIENGIEEDNINIITFENRKLLSQFEKNPVDFIKSYINKHEDKTIYFMLDEFQYVKEGGQKLKLIYDTVENVKVIITGSSSLELKAEVGKYMVGRLLTFHLYPFNFQEVLRSRDRRFENIYKNEHNKILDKVFNKKDIKIKNGKDNFVNEMVEIYENYCIWGGYPMVALSQNKAEKEKVLTDIFNNYILKDVKGLLELTTDENLLTLARHLAAQIGNTVVWQNLGQKSKLNFKQLKKHVKILEETFICQRIKPFFKNRQKELVKNPKIYFIDPGFRNNLTENSAPLDRRSDSGFVVENSVFIQLMQLVERISGRMNFWRKKSGPEVDFIIRNEGKVIPVEIKFSSFSEPKLSSSFISFINSYKPELGLILTKDFWGEIEKNSTKIVFAPVYYM